MMEWFCRLFEKATTGGSRQVGYARATDEEQSLEWQRNRLMSGFHT